MSILRNTYLPNGCKVNFEIEQGWKKRGERAITPSKIVCQKAEKGQFSKLDIKVATEVNFKRDKVAKGAIPQALIGRKQQR